MKLLNPRSLIVSALLSTVVAAAGAAGPGKTVNGIEIFYGVVPAEVIAKPTDKHDPKMHGRKWLSTGSHHLVVSLSDANTGARIDDATVVATVTPLGMAASEKRLEPMLIDQTTTYGNFFDFPASSAPFRIALKITRPTIPAHNAVAAEFEYRPPTSR